MIIKLLLSYLAIIMFNYYVYIITNLSKSTLYIGVTNNLSLRVDQHANNKGEKDSFAGRYYCHYLIYYESFADVKQAIAREKEIKKWRREKKVHLIGSTNPTWQFLNNEI